MSMSNVDILYGENAMKSYGNPQAIKGYFLCRGPDVQVLMF